MIQATGEAAWDAAEDKDLLRQFLETRTGRRLIAKLADEAPALLGKGDTNEILIRNGEARGFAILLNRFTELAYPPTEIAPTPTSQAYPSPEDDNQWNDGNKLNPEQK